MAKMALLTPLGNTKGSNGPGHSALVIGPTVYSFGDNGTWFVAPSKSYMDGTNYRAVVVHELDGSKVDDQKVLAYVSSSIRWKAVYILSGVCSTKTSMAINAGTEDDFDPIGFDTPVGVAKLVEKKKLSVESYFVPATSDQSDQQHLSMYMKINDTFPSLKYGRPHFYEWKM